MYGYIYRTHNLINRKMYIGKRVSSKFLENNYLGSGKILSSAIKKYGRDSFKVELLEEIYEGEEELNSREKYWIDYYNAVESDDYYNLVSGGHGGFSYINDNRLSPSCNGNHPMKGRVGDKNPMYKKKLSESSRKKISDSQKGRVSITDGNITKHILPRDTIPKGFRKGISDSDRKRREDSWNSLRKSLHSDKMSDTVIINNGSITLRVKKSELDNYIRNGYIKGYREDQIRHGENAPAYGMRHSEEFKDMISRNTKGRIWINNGSSNKRVFPDDLEKFIKCGWVKGRIIVRRASTIESITSSEMTSE